jgi:hypothetical protein
MRTIYIEYMKETLDYNITVMDRNPWTILFGLSSGSAPRGLRRPKWASGP